MNYKDAMAKVEEIDKKSRVGEHFKNVVYIDHLDKTKLELWHADLTEVDEWILVSTEHHNTFAYHKEDLENYYSVPIEEAEETVRMHSISLELDKEIVDGLCEFGLEAIKNDKQALINYASNKALKHIIETNGECLGDLSD